MKKYTEQEMIDRGGCGGELIVDCEQQCPFTQTYPKISHLDCYDNGVKKFMESKEKQMESKDSLTYKSLALAINHEIKICHTNMEPHEWIIYCPTQEFWKDKNAIVYSPVFSRIEDWSHWTEPKPEFKPYSVDVWLDTDMPKQNPNAGYLKHYLLNTDRFHYGYREGSHKFKITVEKAED